MKKVLLLRHADRQPVRSARDGFEAGLTLRGRFRSVLVALRLRKDGFGGSFIRTSYVWRCYQTGWWMNHIIRGYMEMDGRDSLLSLGYVDPGFHEDWFHNYHRPNRHASFAERFEFWKRLGVVRMDMHEYAEALVYEISKLKDDSILISHDSNIGPLMESLSEQLGFEVSRRYTHPTYLSGPLFLFEGLRLRAIYWFDPEEGHDLLWEAPLYI